MIKYIDSDYDTTYREAEVNALRNALRIEKEYSAELEKEIKRLNQPIIEYKFKPEEPK